MQLLPPPPGTPSDGNRYFGFSLPAMYNISVPQPPSEDSEIKRKNSFMRRWMGGEQHWNSTSIIKAAEPPFWTEVVERQERGRAMIIKDALWDIQYYKNHFVSQLCELIYSALKSISEVELDYRDIIEVEVSNHYLFVSEYRICLNAMPSTYEESLVRETLIADENIGFVCFCNLYYVLGCLHIDQFEHRHRTTHSERMLFNIQTFLVYEGSKFPKLIATEVKDRISLVRESLLVSLPFLEESRQHLQISAFQTRDRAVIMASRQTFIHDTLMSAEKDSRDVIFTEWLAWVCGTIASELHKHLSKLILIQRWYRQWKALQPSRLLLERKKEVSASFKIRLLSTEDHFYQNSLHIQRYSPLLETKELNGRRLCAEEQSWGFLDIQTQIICTAPFLLPRYLLPAVVGLDYQSLIEKAMFNIIYEERFRRYKIKDSEQQDCLIIFFPAYNIRERLQYYEIETQEREIMAVDAFEHVQQAIDTCNVDFDCFFMTEIISGWIDGSGLGTDYDIRLAKLTKLTQELINQEATVRNQIIEEEIPQWRRLSIWILGAANNISYNTNIESERVLFESKPIAYDLRPLRSGAITGELISLEEHIEPVTRSNLIIVENANRCLKEYKLRCSLLRTQEEFESRNTLFNIFLTTQRQRYDSLVKLIHQGIRLKVDVGVLDIRDSQFRRNLEAEMIRTLMGMYSQYVDNFISCLIREECVACVSLTAAHNIIPEMFFLLSSSTIIQARFRGWRTRKAYPHLLQKRLKRLHENEHREFQNHCAVRIQRAWKNKKMISTLLEGLDAEFC